MSDHVLHAVLRGRVQGVGFRIFVRDAARRHGCTGWVRNLPDGCVEVHAEGTESDLTEMLTDLNQGPPWAHVADIDLTWSNSPEKHDGFRIVR